MYIGGGFDEANARLRYEELKKQLACADLWINPKEGAALSAEFHKLQKNIDALQSLDNTLADFEELLQTEDQEIVTLMMLDIEQCSKKIEKLYIETLFSDNDDASNCFLVVSAGSGGQEAEDWARMLWEMYLKFATQHFKVEILDVNRTENNCIKDATMKISVGEWQYPFGWFKSEIGVHRLVRHSPFNKTQQRHTSFSAVSVFPESADNNEVIINEDEIRIDTYRSSGAGGQHVNKTESAIRITHIPTGIVVQCQNDRSQHRNKDEAFGMLRARLLERKRIDAKKAKEAQAGEKLDISWGAQIRSYVKQPYQLVKDVRTDFEVPNFDKVVFDGELEGFMLAFLKSNH
jgi:peptide chain release factor 2